MPLASSKRYRWFIWSLRNSSFTNNIDVRSINHRWWNFCGEHQHERWIKGRAWYIIRHFPIGWLVEPVNAYYLAVLWILKETWIFFWILKSGFLTLSNRPHFLLVSGETTCIGYRETYSGLRFIAGRVFLCCCCCCVLGSYTLFSHCLSPGNCQGDLT